MTLKVKKSVNNIFLIVICALFVNSANAVVTNNDKGTITAVATEEKLVSPDTASVSFTVQTTDKNSQKAAELNNQKSKNLIEQVKKMLATNESIKTTSYNISQKYEYNNVTKKSFVAGYTVTNVLTVTIKDTAKTGKIIEIATNNGATGVNNLSFTIQSTSGVCKELTQKAVSKAKKEAMDVLTPLGKTIDSVADIQYSCSTNTNFSTYRNYSTKVMSSADSNGIEIESGENRVRASVTIIFTIK